jgi:hypothetical protein
MSESGIVYITRLDSSGALKIGMGRNETRASAGKTYGPVTVLATWRVADRRAAERAAHNACCQWRAPQEGRELFRGDGATMIAAINAVIGPHAPSAMDVQLACDASAEADRVRYRAQRDNDRDRANTDAKRRLRELSAPRPPSADNKRWENCWRYL